MRSLYRIVSSIVLAFIVSMSVIPSGLALEPAPNPTTHITNDSGGVLAPETIKDSNGDDTGLILVGIGVVAGIGLFLNRKKFTQ